jgi:hypothetical protein
LYPYEEIFENCKVLRDVMLFQRWNPDRQGEIWTLTR